MTLRAGEHRIHFHPLTLLPEGADVVVGRTDIDSYAVFPADGAALLEELRSGRGPVDAAEWYFRTYGESVDIDEFLDTLRELNFLADQDAADDDREPVRWQRLGLALFSTPAWLCYAALIAVGIGAACADPRLLPHRHHVFFSHYLLVVEAVLFFGQLPLTLLHESFHVLAGRRLGLRSHVRIGRRLYFLVFETVIDGLVVVPKRHRYLPMLAGMLADVLAMAALTTVAWLTTTPDGAFSLAGRICLALVFTSVLRLVWQFYFFLRTDIYYLVTSVLGCVDLHTVSGQLLRNTVHRWTGRTDRLVDESQWHPRDRQVARWYAPLHAVGYTAMLTVFTLVMIPLGWRFLSGAFHTIFSGTANVASFVDASVLLTLNLGQLATALVMFVKERKQNR